MRYFNVSFEDGGAIRRFAEDLNSLIAEVSEEFPGRNIKDIVEANNPFATN